MERKEILYGILLCWALTSSFLAGYLWFQRPLTSTNSPQKSIKRIKCDFLINYGNSTLVWHNETKIIDGMSVYEGLLLVADTISATRGASGYYIKGINGVIQDQKRGWVFAVKGRKEEPSWSSQKVDDWYYPSVSVDSVIIEENDRIAFLYYNWNTEGYPPPNPTIKKNVR